VKYASKLLDEIPDPIPELVVLARDWHLRCAEDSEVAGRGVVLAGPNVRVSRRHGIAGLLSVMLWRGARGLYVSAPDYVESKKPGANELIDEYEASPYADVDRVDLVLLDHVGLEHRTATQFATTVINDLLRARAEAGRPTIVVTPLKDGTAWKKMYGFPSALLLEESFDPVYFNDIGDYRSPLRGELPFSEEDDTKV
jgi:hypothetical protein